jgi:hypothetical protein
VLPGDSHEAQSVALAAARSVVAGGTAGATVACAGGGSATFSVSGGTLASRANAVLDAGESFSLTFDQCQGAVGAAAVSGAMTLTVVSASGNDLTVDTTTTNLTVALPRRTVVQNGSSRLVQTVAGTTTTQRWTSPRVQVQSQRAGHGTSTFDFLDVDLTREIVDVNGVPVVHSNGHSSLEANLLFFTWRVTLETVGLIAYGPTGLVTSGHWLIDLPDARIELTIASDAVTVSVSAADGCAFFLRFPLDTFLDEAG